jgi:hypothetical protein
MKPQTTRGQHDRGAALRGFIYFREDSLRYVRGPRAWFFLVPYLLGAILLEPQLRASEHGHENSLAWGIFIVYLLAFPSLWQALFLRLERWKKSAKPPGIAGTEEPS